MLHPIPNLQDYDVSPVAGFLPDDPPLERLLDPYYEPWETIAQSLPAFVMTRQVRDYVDTRMPLLTTARLSSEPEWRRACMILSFGSRLCMGRRPAPRPSPTTVGRPMASYCGPFRSASHYFLCLCVLMELSYHISRYSASPVVAGKPHYTLDFTGSYDESWFYLVSTAIEREGAPCLTHGIDAIAACRNGESEDVVKHLQALAEAIDSLTTTLARMFEMCDPHTFTFVSGHIWQAGKIWKMLVCPRVCVTVTKRSTAKFLEAQTLSHHSFRLSTFYLMLSITPLVTAEVPMAFCLLKTTEHDTATPEEKQKCQFHS